MLYLIFLQILGPQTKMAAGPRSACARPWPGPDPEPWPAAILVKVPQICKIYKNIIETKRFGTYLMEYLYSVRYVLI